MSREALIAEIQSNLVEASSARALIDGARAPGANGPLVDRSVETASADLAAVAREIHADEEAAKARLGEIGEAQRRLRAAIESEKRKLGRVAGR